GQASNSDVMSTNLAEAYDAKVVAHESLVDDQKVTRACLKLRLTAKRTDAPYALVEYWIDERTSQPLKAKLYSAEERLLKTAFFRRYESRLGRSRPTETVIVDGLDPKWITVMRTSDVRLRDIPAAWLQRDYLQHFTGDE
ncbi:MAG TPA: outer membrane lipoprotein-sorting protein, partial [Polyangia bacterium]